MLCPEVWNFDPKPPLVFTKFCRTEEEILQRAPHQYFNHHVSIIIPNTMKLPTDLINTVLEDSQYYRINDVPAAALLSKEFADRFVRKGHLTAFSLRENSEDDCVVVTPCGKLILSLSKSSYQKLGVEYTVKEVRKRSVRKYFVILDLISDSNEMQKKCEQVRKKLILCNNLHFDIVLAWEPDSLNICPSSIAYYFSIKGYFVKTCDILHQNQFRYNVTVPVFDEESDESEFIEWLGAFSLDCDLSSDIGISSLRCPEKNENLGQVLYLTFTGLITHSRVKKIISEILNYMKARSSSLWMSLTIQGFRDSSLTVKNKHLCLSNGDHHFTVIFRWNEPSLVYTFHDRSG